MTILKRLAALGVLLLAGGCALHAPAPGTFSFAVVGDAPYNAREDVAWRAMIESINAEPVAFVVHVGDFKGGSEPCTDALYFARKAEFGRFEPPFILTPGDNDWTDCRRRAAGAMDPVERLARLREVFFADRFSLGRRRIALDVQDGCIAPGVAACGCAAHPENRQWSWRDVRFVTLNVPGSNDNVGFDARNDAEARCREEANRQWLARAVRVAQGPSMRGLVVVVQADPFDGARPVYRPLLAQLGEAAAQLGKPVLLVHGDTHTYRADAPFTDASGAPRANPARLETYGSPFVGWVKVTVDPQRPGLFTFEPRLQALVPPAP